jgi:hypothetical protein
MMQFQHAIRRLARLSLLAFAFACAVHADVPAPTPTFTADQLRADLREISRALFEMPADLTHSTDPRAVERAIGKLDERLKDSPPLTRDQAWRAFATLNPLLADGHLFVGFVDWRADVRAHLSGGGSLFPVGVHVTPDCDVSVRHDTRSPALIALKGMRIRNVNGVPMQELCRRMIERIHGDTPAFRADLLERRFWFFYWKVHGVASNYRLVFDSGSTVDLPGSTELPDFLAAEEDFDRQFELVPVPGAAVLKLGTFAWPKKDEVLAFTKNAFETLHDMKTKTLIIDLRDNGGGNDDQWIEGVMPYLAMKRWRTASTYRKRVVTPNPAKGEKVGDVVDGRIETWFEPEPENPLRFGGKVYVAIGPGTYSSAVVMATVFQDFGFGKIIGSGDSVRASQSGGTRRTTLTNTGLIVVSPRFVLRRPSGAKEPELLTPDIAWSVERPLADFPAK